MSRATGTERPVQRLWMVVTDSGAWWHSLLGPSRPPRSPRCSAPLKSDHWFHEVFRVLPDLARQLIPDLAPAPLAEEASAAASSAASEAEPGTPPHGTAYIFRPVALKSVAHHPDGVLWPRHPPGGSDQKPVVLLEVQMHNDPRFQRRLGAETFHLLQQHEAIRHLRVLVLVPHRRLALGSDPPRPLRRFLRQDVTWVDLGALARRPDLDPTLALLTLPVRRQPDLAPTCRRILRRRPDLIDLILPILTERFQGLSSAQLMATLGVSKDLWRHTPLFQEILREGLDRGLAEGREKGMAQGMAQGLAEGRAEGASEGRHREALFLTLRQLERRLGPLNATCRARVETLALERLEELALALLDFKKPEQLNRWLEGGVI